ncbi:hypothetical protein AKO1_012337 [Acrasis kona]|uniref:Uncharacterized protein n=1 Tax=Acrasis kona TaxID=1008807 RepID=A0AAW2YY30_9EUKA
MSQSTQTLSVFIDRVGIQCQNKFCLGQNPLVVQQQQFTTIIEIVNNYTILIVAVTSSVALLVLFVVVLAVIIICIIKSKKKDTNITFDSLSEISGPHEAWGERTGYSIGAKHMQIHKVHTTYYK